MKTYILDDLPTDKDALDFTPYVKTLVNICRTASTPLTIGVFGTWGSGKTSLMRMVQKRLPKNYTVAWFDAWKYDNEETLWRAFLLTVLLAVEAKSGETEELMTLKTMLYRGLELEKTGGVTIDLAKLGGTVAKGAIQIGLSFLPPLAELTKLAEELVKTGVEGLSKDPVDAIRRERTKLYIEQVRSLEQFQEKFSTLVQSYVKPGRLVVFIDDLDRCLPEKAIEVLEAIKLFVDAAGCVFILGLAQDVIARGVEIRYKDFVKEGVLHKNHPIDGTRYLEKIIQLPFTIPPVERGCMDPFVQGLTSRWPDAQCPLVFAEGLGNNPRQIKRTVNLFLMLWQLSKERKLDDLIKPIRLAKVVAIQAIAPELYELLIDQCILLRDIEAYYRQEPAQRSQELAETEQGLVKATKADEKPRQQLSEDLLRLVSKTPGVQKILTMHTNDQVDANFNYLEYTELRLYFTLTRPIVSYQPTPPTSVTQVFEPLLMRIPAGPFKMGTTQRQVEMVIKEFPDSKPWINDEQPQHTVDLGEYAIGKYPVTNREYQVFIQESGHRAPRGWNGSEYPENTTSHPVVNISWDDAEAYCTWLSKKTGKKYRLPTEAEWEKAARGSDGRIYPWGDDFDPDKANTEGKYRGKTPVGQFSPQDDSPYGCADMAGNVWEWCQDWYAPDEYQKRSESGASNPQGPETGDKRVVRGGSWNYHRNHARCASRGRSVPDYFGSDLGFRVVLSPIKPLDS